MDMYYINSHSDDAQKSQLFYWNQADFYFRPLFNGCLVKMTNNSPYHAVLNCELCVWDIVECDVKHTVSVSFWSSFRQDTERLLFLISSACNGSDSWCVCVYAVTTELFPIDTVPAVLWTLPSTDRHLGCCHGENTLFSISHTTLWKSASTWVSWQLMQGKSRPLVMLVYEAVSQIYKMRIISHKSCPTHASSDYIHVLCTRSNYQLVMS